MIIVKIKLSFFPRSLTIPIFVSEGEIWNSFPYAHRNIKQNPSDSFPYLWTTNEKQRKSFVVIFLQNQNQPDC